MAYTLADRHRFALAIARHESISAALKVLRREYGYLTLGESSLRRFKARHGEMIQNFSRLVKLYRCVSSEVVDLAMKIQELDCSERERVKAFVDSLSKDSTRPKAS